MNRIALISILLIFGLSNTQAQSDLPIEEEYASIVSDWLIRSEALRSFEGINEYCQNPNFRESVNYVLDAIHHYDSIILQRLSDPTVTALLNAKEQKKTLKDIYRMEVGYGARDFIDQMRSSCTFRKEIVRNEEELRNGVGYESYDAKVLMLETELQKYLHHVDKLALSINDHLHVLHIE